MNIINEILTHLAGECRYRLKTCRIAQPCYTKKHSNEVIIPEFSCYANQCNTTRFEPVLLRILGL